MASATCHSPTHPGRRARDQIRDEQRRQHEDDDQLLGQVAAADQRAAQHQPARAPVVDGPQRRPQRGHQQQHQQRVGIVVPEDHHRHRREREHHTRNQSGHVAEPAAHGVPHQRHGRHARKRLRHQDAPRVEAEDPHRQCHGPQRHRRLVHRDGVRRVGRSEQERLPRLRTRLGGSRIERIGPALRAEVPHIQHRAADQQRGERPATSSHMLLTPNTRRNATNRTRVATRLATTRIDNSTTLPTVGSKRSNTYSDPLVMASPNANTASPCN